MANDSMAANVVSKVMSCMNSQCAYTVFNSQLCGGCVCVLNVKIVESFSVSYQSSKPIIIKQKLALVLCTPSATEIK